MDLFHDNPLLQGVRQMLGAFAKQQIRPIATKHDREESMPWDLMKAAGALRPDADRGARRPQEADRRRRGSRSEEAEDRRRGSRSSAARSSRGAAPASALALGGSGLACVAGRADGHRGAEGRSSASCSRAPTSKGHIKVAAMALSASRRPARTSRASRPPRARTATTGSSAAASSGSRTASRASVYVVWAQTDARGRPRRRARLHRRARHAGPRAREEGDQARHPRVGDRAGPLRGRAASTRT